MKPEIQRENHMSSSSKGGPGNSKGGEECQPKQPGPGGPATKALVGPPGGCVIQATPTGDSSPGRYAPNHDISAGGKNTPRMTGNSRSSLNGPLLVMAA